MASLLTSTEIAQLHAFVLSGDAIGYYNKLAHYGYDYGRLAAGLVDNESFNSQIARKFAESVAHVKGIALTESDWGTIIQELMEADFAARQDLFDALFLAIPIARSGMSGWAATFTTISGMSLTESGSG